eukprot:m.34860 g.34860  ORF g.34860 m.34860 type:complete len:350 (-) comp9960_c0_seq1:31-1080(-)
MDVLNSSSSSSSWRCCNGWCGLVELNLQVDSQPDLNKLKQSLQKLHHFGYRTVAINQHVEKRFSGTLEPVVLSKEIEDWCFLHNVTLLRRATIILKTQQDSYMLSGSSYSGLRKFDIIAALPLTEKLLAQCVEKLEMDIISVNIDDRLPFRWKVSHIGQAAERGIFIEIGYASLVKGGRGRATTISNAQSIVRISKGKQLICSYVGMPPTYIRSQGDVSCLVRLLGFSVKQSHEATVERLRLVLLHSHMRRLTAKGAVAVAVRGTDNDMWGRPYCEMFHPLESAADEEDTTDDNDCDVPAMDEDKERKEHDSDTTDEQPEHNNEGNGNDRGELASKKAKRTLKGKHKAK